ncbi:MAG TPA: sigma-70 region 4 domain-containing protein, partial [Rhizomicrobium sp.]|nr:sigma-70 region 4 domain-containing protein [Rhizomicrobium sp.]
MSTKPRPAQCARAPRCTDPALAMRDGLLAKYAPLILSIARDFANRLTSGDHPAATPEQKAWLQSVLADFRQEARVKALTVFETWDESRGSFASYVRPALEREMREVLNREASIVRANHHVPCVSADDLVFDDDEDADGAGVCRVIDLIAGDPGGGMPGDNARGIQAQGGNWYEDRLIAALDDRALAARVRADIENLPPSLDRDVLTLSLLDDLEPEDTAERLGMSLADVRECRKRAVKRLRWRISQPRDPADCVSVPYEENVTLVSPGTF